MSDDNIDKTFNNKNKNNNPNDNNNHENKMKYSMVEPNEIILESTSSSLKDTLPIISWKVKNGSTVRIGEIIAHYTFKSSHNNNTTNDGGGNKDKEEAVSNPTSISSSTTSSTTISAKKIIRARKRNRNITTMTTNMNNKNTTAMNTQKNNSHSNTVVLQPITKNSTNTNNEKMMLTSSSSSSGEIEMNDVLKAFGVGNATNTAANTNTNSNNVTTDGGNDNMKETKSITNNHNKDNDKWITIKATMDGIINIYSIIQRRTTNADTTSNDQEKIVFALGTIDECHHPAVIGGLCAVCGQSAISTRKNNVRIPQSNQQYNQSSSTASSTTTSLSTNTTAQTSAFTLSGGVTVSISQDYAQSLSKSTSESLRAAKKLSLVLDLDHTLLHATADRRASKWMNVIPDLHIVLLPLMEGHPLFELQQQNGVGVSNSDAAFVNAWKPHYVKLRPHLAEFLCGVMDKYEITVYTAGTRTYANKIADVISRHVLDYQRRTIAGSNIDSSNNDADHKNIDKKETDFQCLDEGELNDLKQKVARLEERMIWDKSRKERQEYVKKMNEQFELEKKLEQVKNEDNKEDSDIMKNEKEENEKKRRRVCFSEEVITKYEAAEDDKNDSKTQEIVQLKVSDGENCSEDSLEALKSKLRAAEELEGAAQALRKKIFGSRIISRTDLPDLGRDVKSLERVCPCGKMAAIVDDREDVWANADNNATGRKGEPPHNMLLVKPYHFHPFLNFADVNNASGIDLSEQSSDEKRIDDINESEEKQLLWTRRILSTVHDKFYNPSLSVDEQNKLTVPSILTKMRRGVLSQNGLCTKVLLSGLVPLHLQNMDSSNQTLKRHDVVRYVEELGGKLMSNISSDITHVIAAKDGTDKILQARRIPGCAVVRISWLMECYWSITRRDVEPHYLGLPPRPGKINNGEVNKKVLLIESDSDEEEDDDENDEMLVEFKRRMMELQSKK